jgi:signal transduction histidine kinase
MPDKSNDKRRTLRHYAARAVGGKAVPDVTQDEVNSITQALYAKNVELAHTNKTLAILRSIDSLVLDPDNTVSSLAQAICDELRTENGYLFVAIATATAKPRYFQVNGISAQVDETATLRSYIGIDLLARTEFIEGPQHEEIIISGPHARDLSEHFGQNTGKVRKTLLQLGAHRIVANKLSSHDKTLGLLMVGFAASDESPTTEIEFLGRISEACGVAFENKLLNAEIQRVARELKRSNEKLKALDEAKDEFISMASHQLRTPLTSIKGYLSMVLEGDVGDVPPQQKDMLNTAYTSAQRMVYLIADLLNVSRLQTGKFVIEPTECYLPDVVSEELAQLKEAIAAKNITVLFKKPSKFPTMKLDETKIRQVIMNFTDNALYYTPSGGEVTVALAEKPRSVEFTVTDNGMGVPKAEQHKLFGKFFRAGNARKARPDGTGLGLFMAKKVIIASGGAILFKSKEGKGSTFGFTFPKK